jgi:hypothetical protein
MLWQIIEAGYSDESTSIIESLKCQIVTLRSTRQRERRQTVDLIKKSLFSLQLLPSFILGITSII